MVRIPLSPLPNQEFTIVLDKQNCTINIYQRDEYLFADLFVNNDAVQRGALICPMTAINTVSSTKFKGGLFMIDNSRPPYEQALPHYSGLGSRFDLYYVTEQELKQYGTK